MVFVMRSRGYTFIDLCDVEDADRERLEVTLLDGRILYFRIEYPFDTIPMVFLDTRGPGRLNYDRTDTFKVEADLLDLYQDQFPFNTGLSKPSWKNRLFRWIHPDAYAQVGQLLATVRRQEFGVTLTERSFYTQSNTDQGQLELKYGNFRADSRSYVSEVRRVGIIKAWRMVQIEPLTTWNVA